MKTAVVLFNLGGPSSLAGIYPYLVRFFSDPCILRAPFLLRWVLARLIAFKRSRNEARAAYSRIGGKSPLLENTEKQAHALESVLKKGGGDYRVFVCMRYAEPMASDVVSLLRQDQPDRVVLLPLYPQYSTTTSFSSAREWISVCKRVGASFPTDLVCCYFASAFFVSAYASLVRDSYIVAARKALELGFREPRVLFSAHGLPEKIVRDGDPYQWQCEDSARRIAKAVQIPDLDWRLCYQSRVGPMRWIGPSTEDALREAGHDRAPVLICSHAFVSDHVETLVEIEEEYRKKAESFGVPFFVRIPTLGTSPVFIEGLADLVRTAVSSPGSRFRVFSGQAVSCPDRFCGGGCFNFAAEKQEG